MVAAPSPGGLLRDRFPIFRQQTYLNTCSLGALSVQSRARVSEYLELWEARGAAAWYDVWLPALDQLRTRYASLIGAAPNEISLHPSISAAIAAVAEALDYESRPRVVTTALDFPTLAYQWLARRPEGVDLAVVESPDGVEVPLEVFDSEINPKAALVATSHVFFRTGAIQEVASLAELCHARGARLLVDGYQAVGQIPVDVKAWGVDFYCAGGLKWLLGGSGITFLYTDADRTADLEPRVTGWFAHEDPFAFEPKTLVRRTDARRFEAGTPSMASVYAQLGGLDVLEELGLEQIVHVTAALRDDLIERALEQGLRPQVARIPRNRSAIVSIPSRDPAKDVRRLAEARIISDARPGHVRLSPYFYNVVDDHRAALELLARDTAR
jgi:kynureninase